MAQGIRIAKVIAASGMGSRREAEAWVAAGRVTLNGERVESPATFASEKDVILVDGRTLPVAEESGIWLFHKPKGVMTTRRDPEGRETIYNHLPKELQHLHPIGRLDYNSEGLLLLTNDGALKREWELPKTALKRVYRVRMRGCPAKDVLARIAKGVKIDGVQYRPAQVAVESKGSNSWLKVTITEGKNREIRRIFEHFGHPVSRLIRIGYGEYELGNLPTGAVKKAPNFKRGVAPAA